MNKKRSQESGVRSQEKRRKPRRIKAVRGCLDASGEFVKIDRHSVKRPFPRVRVAVIDISDQAALVEQVGCMIYACDEAVYGSKETARYVLENLNIIPKRKGARRG